jgi:DNA helicase-2/ATP-dependent DNA helicase PcrA
MALPASRFLDDIPPEVIEWRRDRSSTESLRAGGSLEWDGGRHRGWDHDGYGCHGKGRGRRESFEEERPYLPKTGAKFGQIKPRAAADIPELRAGDKVTHDTYGLGTVLAVEGAGGKAVARIEFSGVGVKRIALRFAPVEKL